jgi:TIR domain
MADFQTVFMSYSWDSDDHKNWVRLLAERLVSNGVHVFLDQWDVQYGESLTQFMDEKIPESDFVLIICTPAYAVKSVRRQGGVGYEAQIVSARIAASIPRSKFVPVIRIGELKPGAPDCAIPSHFQGIRTIDMRQEAQHNAMFENLLRHIYGQPAVKRPPRGKAPDFSPALPPAVTQALRLANFAIEHWELESGMAMNEQYPKRFWIPDEATRRSLKPGNIVKLMFKFAYVDSEDADDLGIERMWVEITGLSGPYFIGRLRNPPGFVADWHDLEYDSQVVFLPEHVINIEESDSTPLQGNAEPKKSLRKSKLPAKKGVRTAKGSESDFRTYKAKVFKAIKDGKRDRNGFVWTAAEDGEDVNMLARAMKELNEEGRFQEYKTYISPPKWAVRV